MRKFIVKIATFAILVYILDYAIGSSCRLLYFQAKGGHIYRETYISNEMNEEILIFGSSRAVHHYIPAGIHDSLGMTCYNCGQDGLGIFYAYGKWQTIKKRYYPTVILYEITNAFDILRNDNSKYIKLLRPYYDNPQVSNMINEIAPSEVWKMHSKCYPYNSQLISILKYNISTKKNIQAGYSPLLGEMNYIPEVEQFRYDKSEIDPLKLKYFERFISETKKNCLFIACISPQFGQQSSEAFTPILNICEKHAIPVLNHFIDPFFVNTPAYFKDQFHLNDSGARIYTAIIAEEIRDIMASRP